MQPKFEQLHTLKSLTLTDAERGRIRAHVTYLMTTRESAPSRVKSFIERGVYHGLRIALSSFLFFIFIGGTVSAVADSALPGDPLYAFKLNVNEEVKGLFKKTPEQKVAYNAKRVENRVNEIKTLAAAKTLTKAKQATVQKALDSHIKELSTDLNTLSAVAPSAALTVTTNLEETLKANQESIAQSETLDSTAKETALTTVASTIQEVSNQEVKIISKEIDALSTDVSATTTPSTSLTTTTPPTPHTPVEP